MSKKVILSESQVNRLFEYHAQQRLPFMDNYGDYDYEFSHKNMAEEFLDWIEEFGKVGDLGASGISFMDGVKSGYDKALGWFKDKYNNADENKFRKQLSLEGFLNEDGTTECMFDDNGNMYVERAVRLPEKLGSVTSGEFERFVKNYQNNVGGCWSWKTDGAMDYCDEGDGDTVVMCGWIRLDDIDWVETVYCNAYVMNGECEIRVRANAMIKLVAIHDINSGYKLKLERPLIVRGTYFGNQGKYNGDYAEIYDAQSDVKTYMDRQGIVLSGKDIIYSKIKKLNNNHDLGLEDVFNTYRSLDNGITYLVYDNDKVFFLSLDENDNYFVMNDTLYDNVEDKVSYYKLKIGDKYNIMNKKTYQLIYDNWYEGIYKFVRGGCFVLYNGQQYGIAFNDDKNVYFVFDDVDQLTNCDNEALKKEWIEVMVDDKYNLIDAFNGKFLSNAWFDSTYWISNMGSLGDVLSCENSNVYILMNNGKVYHSLEELGFKYI